MLGTGNVVGLLIDLIIAGIVIYGVYLFLGLIALPPQLKQIVLLVIAVIALVFLGHALGVL